MVVLKSAAFVIFLLRGGNMLSFFLTSVAFNYFIYTFIKSLGISNKEFSITFWSAFCYFWSAMVCVPDTHLAWVELFGWLKCNNSYKTFIKWGWLLQQETWPRLYNIKFICLLNNWRVIRNKVLLFKTTCWGFLSFS